MDLRRMEACVRAAEGDDGWSTVEGSLARRAAVALHRPLGSLRVGAKRVEGAVFRRPHINRSTENDVQ